MNNSIIIRFLSELGLTTEEIKIYLTLTEKGSLTILELARITNINRTRVYRLVEVMHKKGLLEEIVEEYRQQVKAVDIHQLDLLIKEKERQSGFLREAFPQIGNLITQQKILQQPTTKVVFYRGVEGIKQMGWNTLQAKKEVLGFTYRQYSEIVGEKFTHKWYEEMFARKICFREIYSDTYLKSLKTPLTTSKDPLFQQRYISSKILDINHQSDIYNNVVTHYNWYEGEIFGVEIYNEKVAQMQKQIFNIVWKMAKMKK